MHTLSVYVEDIPVSTPWMSSRFQLKHENHFCKFMFQEITHLNINYVYKLVNFENFEDPLNGAKN